jgi:hypothetical protein
MKIAVDTKVLIGGWLGADASSHVIEVCLRGQCQPLIGSALLAEYEDVCGRAGMFSSGLITDSERNERLDVLFS